MAHFLGEIVAHSCTAKESDKEEQAKESFHLKISTPSKEGTAMRRKPSVHALPPFPRMLVAFHNIELHLRLGGLVPVHDSGQQS